MTNSNLEQILKIRDENERIIIDEAKRLITEYLQPDNLHDLDAHPKYARHNGTTKFAEGKFGIQGWRIQDYLTQEHAPRFKWHDVSDALRELKSEDKVYIDYATFWSHHQDETREFYRLR